MTKQKRAERHDYLLTSESVTEGHPDKVCDQISDSVLDYIMKKDKDPSSSRVACETYITMGLIIVGGEIRTEAFVDIHKICRELLRNIGYTHPKYGLDCETVSILNAIHTQSPDIAQGVDTGGAGDQGLMMGYACNETKELMPLPIMLAHKLVRRAAEVRKKNILKFLGPDGKSQVTVLYENGKPKKVTSVVLACQHTADVLDKKKQRLSEEARKKIINTIAKPVLEKYIDKDTIFYVNETGKFVIGGPQCDTGMTGRKIIVDTYGGIVPHGGGAFSGKDPTKVDRSASYMSRYVAKNIVAAGLADRCLMQLSYVIGRKDPTSITVDTYGTSKIPDNKLIALIKKNFDLTPRGMIRELNLLRPIYFNTACYGHFGREEEGFTWEETDAAELLRKKA